jgi:microcin C transport system substrate-binding protein
MNRVEPILLHHAWPARVGTLAFAALLALAGPAGRAAPARDDPPPAPPAAAATAAAVVKTGSWEHAISSYVPPKYPRGFTHFEYVDPEAPKGGVLRLRNPDRRSSFDKYNPFTVRGNAPAGLTIYMFEPLAQMSQDEPQAMYGLLAEEIYVAPDLSSISFRLHPKARFANGDRVTPADVKQSFEHLSGPQAAPSTQSAYESIERVVVVDSRTVRFDLKDRKTDVLYTAGTMPVFSARWVAGRKFDEVVSEHPITSGPYVIHKVDMPRRIEFKRNPDYWARDLGVRRGWFNFDRVVYLMYQDHAISREAFKAGEFDIMKEYGMRSWMRLHQGVKWRDGRIAKQEFKVGTGQALQSYNLNLRRPLFQDIRVREALGYTYDFETLNRYGKFKRANSVFNNSEFAAQGMPSPGELALLEPFRAELPPRVFGPAFAAPRTDNEPTALRRNLLKARELLEQAGWKLAPDGKLRNAEGRAFEFEYLTPREGGLNDWIQRLEKLGITLKERVVDFALYRRRLEQYDYDMITIVEGSFTLPSAASLRTLYGSKSADEPGNNNFRGVKSKAADHLIEVIGSATTLEELRDAARAFDRVVMWSFWQVPDLYSDTENASYWNRFGIPAVSPDYFTIDTYLDEYGPWPVRNWWDLAVDPRAASVKR